MEDRRAPWPLLILVCAVTVAASAYVVSYLTHSHPSPGSIYEQAEATPPFDLSGTAPRLYRGGPPGNLARDNAEYPVGNGPADELLPGRWAAYPPGADCKWTIQLPSGEWIAGSTQAHWQPGTAVYIQLDAGVRFQTVNCGTWFLTTRPTPSPRIR